jgi:hypothetical protein
MREGLKTKFGGLFLGVEDAAGWSGRGLFEGFRFLVGHAAGDDRGEDAGVLALSTLSPLTRLSEHSP